MRKYIYWRVLMNEEVKLNNTNATTVDQNDLKKNDKQICLEIKKLIDKLLAEKKQNEICDEMKQIFNLANSLKNKLLKARLDQFNFTDDPDFLKKLDTENHNNLLSKINNTIEEELKKDLTKDLTNEINNLILIANDTIEELKKLLLKTPLPGAQLEGDKSVIEALNSVKGLKNSFIKSRKNYVENPNRQETIINAIRDSIKAIKPQNETKIYQRFLAKITKQLYESKTFNPIITRLSKLSFLTKMGLFREWNKLQINGIKNDFYDNAQKAIVAPVLA